MQNYLKWLIITSLIIVLYGVLEYYFQTFSAMAVVDPTCICYIIWGMLGFIMVAALVNTNSPNIQHLTVLAFIVSSLGLLGTFWGMKEAFGSVDIVNMDIVSPEAVKLEMGNLFLNMFIAMNTTVTGLFVSIPTMLYVYFTGDKNEPS